VVDPKEKVNDLEEVFRPHCTRQGVEAVLVFDTMLPDEEEADKATQPTKDNSGPIEAVRLVASVTGVD